MHVLQRLEWYGEPTELGDLFRPTKNRCSARGVLLSHQFGWELRLLIGAQDESFKPRSDDPRRKCSPQGRRGRQLLEQG